MSVDRQLAESALMDAALQLEDPDGWSFDAARGGDVEDYAEYVVRRGDQIGALFAACEDVADVFGSVDYDATEPALFATLEQWRKAADSLTANERLATRLRATAFGLERELSDKEFDPEYATDLISIASTHERLLNLAAEWILHRDKKGDIEEWWDSNTNEVLTNLRIRTGLLEDVAKRGEELPPEWRP